MSTFSNKINNLYSVFNSRIEEWYTEEVFLDVCPDLNCEETTQINLVETLGFSNKCIRTNFGPSKYHQVYWLPSKFCDCEPQTRIKHVGAIFIQACRKAGFNLRIKGWEKKYCKLRFICQRGRAYQEYKPKEKAPANDLVATTDTTTTGLVSHPPAAPSSGRNKKRRRSRKKSSKSQPKQALKMLTQCPVIKRGDSNIADSDTEHTSNDVANVICPFTFGVYWHPIVQRWFIPKQQSGCVKHCGHLKRTSDQVRIGKNHVPSKDQKLMHDLLSSHFVAPAVSTVIYNRSGIDLEPYQIYDMHKTLKDSIFLNQRPGFRKENGHNARPTAADSLLANLDANPRASYIVLYGDYDSNLLTIRRRSKISKKATQFFPYEGNSVDDLHLIDEKTLHNQPAVSVNADVYESTVHSSELADEDGDSAEVFADKVRSSLNITGSGLILLAIAWTNDQARRRFGMFPEFTAADVTEGTNSEKRPLMMMGAKDSNNNSFIHTWSFLPSQSRWVFDWFFGSAVPALHHPSTLSRISLIRADQSREECSAIQALCGLGKTYPNAVH